MKLFKIKKWFEKSHLSIVKRHFFWFFVVLLIVVVYDICYLSDNLIEVQNDKLPDLVHNVMIETHGLLFDLFIFGLIISWFEKRETKSNAFNKINSWKRKPHSTSIESVLDAIETLNKQGITAIGLKKVDFTDIDLSNKNLSEGSLKNANLTRAVLKNLILKGTDLRGATLNDVEIQKGWIIQLKEWNAIGWEKIEQDYYEERDGRRYFLRRKVIGSLMQ